MIAVPRIVGGRRDGGKGRCGRRGGERRRGEMRICECNIHDDDNGGGDDDDDDNGGGGVGGGGGGDDDDDWFRSEEGQQVGDVPGGQGGGLACPASPSCHCEPQPSSHPPYNRSSGARHCVFVRIRTTCELGTRKGEGGG
jgi:hypothetical protein